MLRPWIILKFSIKSLERQFWKCKTILKVNFCLHKAIHCLSLLSSAIYMLSKLRTRAGPFQKDKIWHPQIWEEGGTQLTLRKEARVLLEPVKLNYVNYSADEVWVVKNDLQNQNSLFSRTICTIANQKH